jgi:hypothetical protein
VNGGGRGGGYAPERGRGYAPEARGGGYDGRGGTPQGGRGYPPEPRGGNDNGRGRGGNYPPQGPPQQNYPPQGQQQEYYPEQPRGEPRGGGMPAPNRGRGAPGGPLPRRPTGDGMASDRGGYDQRVQDQRVPNRPTGQPGPGGPGRGGRPAALERAGNSDPGCEYAFLCSRDRRTASMAMATASFTSSLSLWGQAPKPPGSLRLIIVMWQCYLIHAQC